MFFALKRFGGHFKCVTPQKALFFDVFLHLKLRFGGHFKRVHPQVCAKVRFCFVRGGPDIQKKPSARWLARDGPQHLQIYLNYLITT